MHKHKVTFEKMVKVGKVVYVPTLVDGVQVYFGSIRRPIGFSSWGISCFAAVGEAQDGEWDTLAEAKEAVEKSIHRKLEEDFA